MSTIPQPQKKLKKHKRIISHIKGKSVGPTLIFFGGIHGNEPAGVKALEEVNKRLETYADDCRGEFFALAGNLNALAKEVRFEDEDLNRIWFPERLSGLTEKNKFGTKEEEEMQQLYVLLRQILDVCKPPFYFFDLHTTSGPTEPFLIMNDSLLNRRFTKNFPLPTILGIEEYLEGALLSYFNDLGYVSVGFESGQHETEDAIHNAQKFIWLTLPITGFYKLDKSSFKSLQKDVFKSGTSKKTFYEIYFQRLLIDQEYFQMFPGYKNFQKIAKGQAFAEDSNGLVITKKNRQIFMPLYQKKGDEAYYFIRRIPEFFLALSKYMRWTKLDELLTFLPGVQWLNKEKDALVVNKKITRFLAKSLFHLLGYRTRSIDQDHYIIRNREYNAKSKEYKTAIWY